MFRSKKKKVGGRKRREVEAEGETDAAVVSAKVSASSMIEDPAENEAEEAENELQRLEELRRSRSRSQKGSMTFSSKSSTKSRGNVHSSVAAVHVEAVGLLSFDDEGGKEEKKRKMRPNLVAATTVDAEMEMEGASNYSAEMLVSLRSEQSALPGEKEEIGQQDVEMEDVLEVEAGNDEEVERVVQEEEEEFISLDGGKQTRRTKNRVTFGLHANGPGISKSAEVVEQMSGEDEDDEQNRRWEEELMRRGGHRVASSTEAQGTRSRSRDGLPTYPTRKKVASVSLGVVLGKLEKSLESTSFEDDRVSRELARLEAETALIESTLKQQQEELLVSSEEFEYFQEIEDFVKGLSFCLREKVPVIEAKEKSNVEKRAQQVDSKRQDERVGLTEEVKLYLASGKLQQNDVVGLTQLDLLANGNVPAQHDARVRRYQQHFTESYVAESHQVVDDLFADAIDEINSLERVYGHFQEWKAKFPGVYKNSYCEVAQEKLFAPYVQAELLSWDLLAVADSETTLGKAWSLDDFAWFRVLHRHPSQAGDDGVDGPLLHQIRDVLLEKVRGAVSSYLDPYSSLQARSLSLILEEITRRGYFPYVEGAVQALATTALENFSSEAKRTVLIAIDRQAAASSVDVSVFARYFLERFNALQDNLLTLFVALPKGAIAAAGFRCLLQVLHHLLAYTRHCQETQKMQLVGTATQVVRQLSGSSYLLQILSEPSQERELKHLMDMFSPFLQSGAQ